MPDLTGNFSCISSIHYIRVDKSGMTDSYKFLSILDNDQRIDKKGDASHFPEKKRKASPFSYSFSFVTGL